MTDTTVPQSDQPSDTQASQAATAPAPELAVVVPVKNETDNVFPLIEEIYAALNGRLPFEIIYVDDGSDDATPARLDEAKERFPMLRVIRHRTSCGQSQAVHTGVRAARAPWIATLDGDGQNDPADIPAALDQRDLIARQNDCPLTKVMIAGHRQKRLDNGLRKLSSKVANSVRSSMLKDDTPDSGCGLKLFARETFLGFPRFDHMHRFLPALMRRDGGIVVSVRVNHRPRERGTSKYGLWNRLWVGIVDLFGVWWLQRRVHNPDIARQD